MDTKNTGLPSAAIGALEQGNKIEAIKLVRAAKALDLKDSKNLVEQYLRDNPSLSQRFSAIQSEHNRRGILWVLLLLIVGCVTAYFVTGKM